MKMKTIRFVAMSAMILIIVLGMAMTSNAADSRTLSVGAWTEQTNPVFDPAEKAYYPTVLFDGVTYQMWYDTGTGTIYYTTSSDGIAWEPGTPTVISTTTVRHPHVEKIGAKYAMWYWDTTQLYSINAIRYAESTDGINWTNDQAITQIDSSVIATSGWNRGTYSPCDVIYNASGSDNITTPTDAASVWANKFVMYYDGTTGGQEAIGLAVSADGIQWQGYNGGLAPVINAGGNGAWDSKYTSMCTVIKESDTLYQMFYCGGTNDVNNGIGHATSTDGITWTRDAKNPYFSKNDGVAWRSGRTYTPAVINDGGVYKMWFTGVDSGDTNYAIGYITANGPFTSIQSAINAANDGDTINVAPGTYTQNLVINKAITLQGENAATTIISGTGGTAVTINANDVTISGFTITNPAGKSGISATDRSGITISGNIINGIGSSDATIIGTNFGIGIISSATAVDNINITNNHINSITGGNNKSADGIAIGWSNGTQDITNLVISSNNVSNITSDNTVAYASGGRGAYGILINHSTSSTGGKTVDAQILDNNISQLHGLWSHGIGLEGNTPGITVQGNTISDLTSTKHIRESTPNNWNDAVAVMVEANTAVRTVTVSHNKFINVAYGVVNVSGADYVNATKNWWNTGDDTAIKAKTGGAIAYDPYYNSDAMDTLGRNKPVYNTTQDIGYDTIQSAIDNTNTGDIVTVAAGNYNETFTVSKSIELRGAKYGIDARTRDTAGETILDTPLDGVISLSANNIIIDGFTIESDTGAGRVETWGNNIRFLNNIAKRTVYPRGNPSGLTFSYNLFTGTASTQTVYGSSLYIEPSVSASNNRIEYNKFTDLLYSGIILATTSTPYTNTTISNNEFYRTQSQAINIAGNQAGLTISNNYIDQANIIQGADRGGIRLYGSAFSGTVNIFNNTVNNSFNGICIVTGQNIAGKDIHVHHNTLTNNANAGVYNGGTGTLDATKNWWGVSDKTAIQALSSGSVNYDPWYDSSAMTTLATNRPVFNTTQGASFDTIQAAIDSANASDTITVAAGDYTEQLLIQKSIYLIGAGETTTNIIAPATRTGSVTQTTSSGAVIHDYLIAAYAASGTIDVRIEGFTLDLNGQNKTSSTGQIDGVFFRDVKDAGGTTAGLFSCTVHNFAATPDYEAFGVVVYGDSLLTLDENDIHDYTRDGMSINRNYASGATPNITISRNHITGSAASLEGINIGSVTAGEITGNTVTGNTRSDPWAGGGIAIWSSTGVMINGENHVDGNYYGIDLCSGSHDITISGNVLTGNIKRGISLGSCGATNNNIVSGNTITGPVNGTDDVAIGLSNDSTGNIIGGPATADGNIINMAVSDTSGNTTPGNLYAIHMTGNGAAVSNTIQNNRITGGQRGIQFDGPPGITGTTTITDNTFTGQAFGGICAYNNGHLTINSNTLTNTTRPIDLWGPVNVAITGNTIDGAVFDGINLGNVSGTKDISGNTISNIPQNNAAIHGRPDADNLVINNNTISASWVGIQVDTSCTGNQITNNNLHDNTWSAMAIYGDTTAITGNTFTNNQRGIETDHSITVRNNSFVADANTHYAQIILYSSSAAYEADVSQNWWGTTDPSVFTTNWIAVNNNTAVYSPWWGADFAGSDHSSAWTWYTNDSIQEAINIAAAGDTITITAGTYNGAIDVNKRITLQGAGSDNVSGTVLKNTTGSTLVGGYRPVILLSTNGTADNHILIKDLAITTNTVSAGASQPGIFTRLNSTVTYIELNNVHITGSSLSGTGETGLLVENSSSLNHLKITNCLFRNMAYGINFEKTSAAYYQDNCEYIEISDTTFDNNSIKGMYAEKLSNATFTNVVVTNNSDVTKSPDWAAPWNSGIDINLKYGDYQNLVFNNLTVDGNGDGHIYGTGLVIKARGTGTDSYGDVWGGTHHGATLSNVQINGGTFVNNVIAIRFGDPAKNNTSPTNITIRNVSISKSNRSGGVVNYLSGVSINAINNYWDSAAGPVSTNNKYYIGSQGSSANGTISYVPWLETAGGASFAPVANGANKYDSIQAAINAATAGDIINVAPGIFTETININKSITLRGATYNINKNGKNVPFDYAWDSAIESIIVHPAPAAGYLAIVNIEDIDNVTFEGFIVQEVNAVDNLNTSLVRVYAHTRAISNIIVRNNIIGPNTNKSINDGTDGRMGLYIVNHPYSSQYGVTNSTFSGNKIFDCKGNGDDIFIWSSYQNPDYGAAGPASMAGTVIENNEIYGAHRSGIETSGGYSGLTIQNNKIYNNGGDTMSGKPDIMYGNGIVLIRGSGDSHSTTITGYGPQNLTIRNNEIYSNQRNGIYMGPISNDFVITGNKIYNNGSDGIQLDLAERYNNPDFENGTRVPWPDKTTNIAVSLNRIYGNTGYGVQIMDQPTNGFRLDARNNWWGTASATDVDAKISGAVDYSPWHLKQLTVLPSEQITNDSLVLVWSTEGAWDGNYYDFRYSTTPITPANWNSAKKLTGEPVPANATQKMIVRGLKAGTQYYFGLVLVDGTLNSDISQKDTATPALVVIDITKPAAITSLAASAGSPSTTSIVLNWTATGDDGANGFASKYIIKKSTSPVTEANFDAAATVYNSLTPKGSGLAETMTITKLNPDTQYYFAIKAIDEANNISAISNVVNLTTAADLPTVTSITADPAGTDNGAARTLTIAGTNFTVTGSTTVRLISSLDILVLHNVTVNSATSLTAVVPVGVPTGIYQAKVSNTNGTSVPSTVVYTVTAAPVPLPVVTNAIPNITTSNTPTNGVKIFGEHLNGATAVTINGHAATLVTVDSATTITVNIPGLAAGEYDIKVTTPSGTNDVSSVKFIVTVPVVIDNTTTEDTSTSDTITLTSDVIPVQITLTTDDSENATRNTNTDVEISVTIPPDTSVSDKDGNPYTGNINPPRVVKPDTSVQTDLPADAIVIQMGNPDRTINFSQDFVAVVTVTANAVPQIYYFNKDTGKYELAGKAGTQDGITYVPGGVVLSESSGTYTIGLLLDHMSIYVSSTESLLPPAPSTGGGGGGGGGEMVPSGNTNVRGIVSSAGRFTETVVATSKDEMCSLTIPSGTIGLDDNLRPLTVITITTAETTPSLPAGWNIIGPAYTFGPSGASFDPGATLKWNYSVKDIPEGITAEKLSLAYYDETAGKWIALESTVDVDRHVISASITHFTLFAVISIPKPAEFVLGALNISANQLMPGETATISVTVTNTGDIEGSYTVILTVNGIKESEKTVVITAGHRQEVSFNVVKETAGLYNIELNGLAGSFTVITKPTPVPPVIKPQPTLEPEPKPQPEPELTVIPAPVTTPAATAAAVTAKTSNWSLILIVIAAGVVVAAAITTLWLKKRRD